MKDKTAEGEFLLDDLSNYDAEAYDRPSVTVDICICTIKDGDLKVLLIKRKHPPFRNFWAIPGGFVDVKANETLQETAERELREETSAENVYLEQLKTYGDPGRDPRMRVVTVAYFALIPETQLQDQNICPGSDAKETGWFSLRDLPVYGQLAFDHKEILSDLLTRLEGKISYTPIAFSLVPKRFTWAQLQQVYEIVLGKKLSRANLRRKVRSMYRIRELKSKRLGKRGRPSVYLRYEGMKNF